MDAKGGSSKRKQKVRPGPMQALKPSTIRRMMRRNYPGLPAQSMEYIVNHWQGQEVETRVMNNIVHMIARTYIRHELTDYDHLLSGHKLSKQEARLCVKDEIDDYLAYFKIGPPPPRIDDGFIGKSSAPLWIRLKRRARRLFKRVMRRMSAG